MFYFEWTDFVGEGTDIILTTVSYGFTIDGVFTDEKHWEFDVNVGESFLYVGRFLLIWFLEIFKFFH